MFPGCRFLLQVITKVIYLRKVLSAAKGVALLVQLSLDWVSRGHEKRTWKPLASAPAKDASVCTEHADNLPREEDGVQLKHLSPFCGEFKRNIGHSSSAARCNASVLVYMSAIFPAYQQCEEPFWCSSLEKQKRVRFLDPTIWRASP